MESDIENRRFQVPWEIMEELESAGYVGPATDLVVKGGVDVGDLTVSPAG